MSKSFATLLAETDLPLIQKFKQENEIQRALREETVRCVEHHAMMSSPEQAKLLMFLIRLIGVQRVIEIGVFTGYGTLAMAQALPEQGYLLACDKNSYWPAIGQPYWEQAGVTEKIDLRIAPALETLQSLRDEGRDAYFDFIFVDGDKIHYPDYFKFGHFLLRQGGIMIFDNVLRVGAQHVVKRQVPATRAIAGFLESLSHDNRYDLSLIPIAQGMLLARKC